MCLAMQQGLNEEQWREATMEASDLEEIPAKFRQHLWRRHGKLAREEEAQCMISFAKILLCPHLHERRSEVVVIFAMSHCHTLFIFYKNLVCKNIKPYRRNSSSGWKEPTVFSLALPQDILENWASFWSMPVWWIQNEPQRFRWFGILNLLINFSRSFPSCIQPELSQTTSIHLSLRGSISR